MLNVSKGEMKKRNLGKYYLFYNKFTNVQNYIYKNAKTIFTTIEPSHSIPYVQVQGNADVCFSHITMQ